MRALTVCQPYAHLLALPEDHPEAKPIENRPWPTRYRGLLLIHAGKSQDWLEPEDIATWPDMAFGSIVAAVDLLDCVEVGRLPERLRGHKHANGPFCLITGNVRRLAKPVPCRGYQGFWYVEPDVERAVLAQLQPAPVPHACDEDCRCCGECYRLRAVEVCNRTCEHAQVAV